MENTTNKDVRKDMHEQVREQYGKIARGEAGETGCCGGSACGNGACAPDATALGYSEAERAAAPAGADMGLGCGNPQAIAALRPGETVLDLGSGGGFDAFLAARQVGPAGRVIGVDMTPDMLAKARANAAKVVAPNVEFRLGEIEHLPIADRSIDVIISNCVVNLAPDKAAVYREALRVLKPGGRLAIMDVVATGPLPAQLLADPAAFTGCLSGATPIDELVPMLTALGFVDVRVEVRPASRQLMQAWSPGTGVEHYVASASIQAVRPQGEGCCGSSPAAPCC